jgi:hypothetical protein
MRSNSKFVVILLLCAVAAALPGAQALALSSVSLPSAGCHGHAPAAPAPASYQCCINGHHWTLPSSAISVRPLFARLSEVEDDSRIYLISSLRFETATSVVPASSPPGCAPLRI